VGDFDNGLGLDIFLDASTTAPPNPGETFEFFGSAAFDGNRVVFVSFTGSRLGIFLNIGFDDGGNTTMVETLLSLRTIL
jgi:hypothetical protein